ncbi:hypothetical protein [Leptospira noguchii]|uniref:Uncharacterized protein n=1 Tax=Leptospira noguchii TaxID=28182 RepID=A0AAE9KAU3_9LEPT|nr:hypothetical protein [Leptospira noguchii]UOG32817.1 hypothetical protein MAL06_21065 [Leptospira noguchii]UOG58948.1 hypothetical protein MAL03_20920 [Leptospira noguchii]
MNFKIYLLILLFFNFCSRYTIKGPIFENEIIDYNCNENKKRFYINEVYINEMAYSESLREYISDQLKTSINNILLRDCYKNNSSEYQNGIPIKITVNKFEFIERKRYLYYIYAIFPIIDFVLNNSMEYSYAVDLTIEYKTAKEKREYVNTFNFCEKRVAGIFELNKPKEENVFRTFRVNVTKFILRSIIGES